MKSKFYLNFILGSFVLVSILAGCKKEDDEPVPLSYAKVALHLHSNVGDAKGLLNKTFINSEGRNFQLKDFRYYISNVKIIRNDGSELSIKDSVYLVNPANQDYFLTDSILVGEYKGIKFDIGVDSVINHSDPTVYPSYSPLAIQTPGIHWSWNSGYIFFKVDGIVDSTDTKTGAMDKEFFYHIGLDKMKRTIDLSNNSFTIEKDVDNEIGLDFDLLKVLNTVQMHVDFDTHSFNNQPLAIKIANNWQSAFSFE